MGHSPQISRSQPTPTRWPILKLPTEDPRAAIRPTPSCPRISRAGPSFPDARPKSVPQTPVAERETRSSSGFNGGRGSSLILNSNEKSSLRLRVSVNAEAIE
jgi:hypothetical protein